MLIDSLYTIEREIFSRIFGTMSDDVEKIYSGNLFLAIFGLHKALAIAEKENISPVKEQIMLSLAYRYEENDNPGEAVYWYEKCLNEPYYANDAFYKMVIIANLVRNLVQCNELFYASDLLEELAKIGEIQDTTLKDQLLAIKYYIEAEVAFYRKNKPHNYIENLLVQSSILCKSSGAHSIFAYLDTDIEEMLGELYSNINDFPRSLEHFESAKNLAEAYRNEKRKSVIYGKMSSVYEKMGDLKSAVDMYKKYYRLSENIHRQKSRLFSDYLLEIYNIGHVEDIINQLRDINKKLANKRNTDYLTGIYNRRFWDETVRYKVVEKGIETSPVSVLMLDIDSFKKYNDHYGHVRGDMILKKIGEVLKNSVARDTDVVARYGGEEFIILLDATGVKGSKKVASEVLDNIKSLDISINPEDPDDILSLSIGISTGTIRSESNIYDLIRNADKALYYSKRNGKGRYTHFNDIS
jgi:diguanylate cyclase (GGDEF)-like protein